MLLGGRGTLVRAEGPKPPLGLDTFFNSVPFTTVALSPDGENVVIGTERADWKRNRFRDDLWLYRRKDRALVPLTQSGHDTRPQWSPDGRWIAFLRDRPNSSETPSLGEEPKNVRQVYVISADGGEPFRVTAGTEDVHAFAWSADAKKLCFATCEPWPKKKEEAYQKEWKDVIQYRAALRSDRIFEAELTPILAWQEAGGDAAGNRPEPKEIAATPYRVEQLATARDGKGLAFVTTSKSLGEESLQADGIYILDIAGGKRDEGGPIPLRTHPQAFLDRIE